MPSRFVVYALVTLLLTLAAAAPAAIQPADGDLIPEARALLDYLQSVYGKKTLSGTWGPGIASYVQEASGRLPAIVAFDLTGWNSPTWGKTYTPVVERTIEHAKAWHARGGIVAFQFHWKHPMNPSGTSWRDRPKNSPRYDLAKAAQVGTPEHKAFMDDLARHADYLQKLADARIPILWRPFHEIDGGWFWWTDHTHPENTAALWRIMFDYLVKQRKLHNLIWVFNCGLKTTLKREAPPEEHTAFRKRYYPGPQYVDIAGIDIYPNSYYGWGKNEEESYPKAFQIMQEVAPGKMQAMCECGTFLNVQKMAAEGPRWLYVLQWFEGDAGWARTCYAHPQVLTLEDVPAPSGRAVPAVVRIDSPPDGLAPVAGDLAFDVRAMAKGAPVARVELRLLKGGWHNWFLMDEEKKGEALKESTLLCEAKASGRLVWKDAPPGLHQVVAQAFDDKGNAALSNSVRLRVGLTNLAGGKTATASSKAEKAQAALDDSLFTAWSSDKKDAEWLCVDLGSVRTVSAVTLFWAKANAKAYRVEVAPEANKWSEVHSETRSRGGLETVSFPPAKARYVRLAGVKRGTEWGGYTLYDLGVYESLPK